jgi:hypothetical protein
MSTSRRSECIVTNASKLFRVGLIASRQHPFIEWSAADNRWRIWMMFNTDLSGGTYFDLYPNGQIDRVTILENDVIDIVNYLQPL